jgi:hypothetical protein
MASGDIRPDEAIEEIVRCLRAGKHPLLLRAGLAAA